MAKPIIILSRIAAISSTSFMTISAIWFVPLMEDFQAREMENALLSQVKSSVPWSGKKRVTDTCFQRFTNLLKDISKANPFCTCILQEKIVINGK